jgi:hypothetical protein
VLCNRNSFVYIIVEIAPNGLEVVFEGVTVNSKADHFVPHFSDAAADNPRVQMAAHGAGAAYTLLHQEQLRNIIEGYDVYAGDEEPIKFDHKQPKPNAKKRKTNNFAGENPNSSFDLPFAYILFVEQVAGHHKKVGIPLVCGGNQLLQRGKTLLQQAIPNKVRVLGKRDSDVVVGGVENAQAHKSVCYSHSAVLKPSVLAFSDTARLV